METFICEHQINISMCSRQNCEKCGHKGNEASCPLAKNKAGSAMPTFEEAIELFKNGSSSDSHKRNVECQIRVALRLVGLTEQSKLIEMSFDRFELLIEKLKSDLTQEIGRQDAAPTCGSTDDASTGRRNHGRFFSGKPHRNATIQSYLDAFNSLTSDEVLTALRKLNKTPYRFAKPKFDPPKEPKQFVTYDQIRKVEIEMEKLFASGKKSDLKVALLLFFAIHTGLRLGEICHLKWGNIQMTEEGVKLIHVPLKTLRYCQDKVSIPFGSRSLSIVRPYIGKPDEDVIPLDPKYIPKYLREKATHTFSRKFRYQVDRANKIFANAGIGTEYKGQKKLHAARKFRETVDAAMYGGLVSASWRGHTERVARQSYISDPSTLTSGSSRPLVAA